MVVRRTKKVSKYRGHTTHGGGHRKKRRGAGSRGGRGNAGTGKRAGQKKAGRVLTLGRSGFTPRGRTTVRSQSVNLSYFDSLRLEALVSQGKARKEGNTFQVDCSKLGFTKLLGTGSVRVALQLTIDSWSAKAQEKVEAAGGSVQAASANTEASA